MKKAVKVIDSISQIAGECTKWILCIMVFSLMFEVVARYIFNSPTIWVADICEQCVILIGAFGGAYAYLSDSFVRVDLLYEKFSLRTKALLDIITFLIFALFISMTTWQCIVSAQTAWEKHMVSSTVLRVPYYWSKTIVAAGCVLLMLQGLSVLFKNLYVLRYNEPYPANRKEGQ
ncbi:TRAP transporter small permease [Oscillibacter hominis]|uniref:TRAP transporter small permease n=1 Tax=Oscillibacter hominis TaxID=2763056 RepID=A0A7G9B1T5_9FIRM|nr:TRAP transporter small permease [Oscillibacter hominis]QNL43516.1 TRAP transporter small permease [Oscillibacter hominis]